MLVVLMAASAITAAPSTRACTLGSGFPERDLAAAYASSPEVFVARLHNYQERQRQPRSPLFFATADYDVLEVLKGEPPARGTVTGGVVWRAVPDMPNPPPPPPPACGPWITSPDIEGQTALIFVSPPPEGGDQALRQVDPFSVRLGPPDSDYFRDTLKFVHQLKSTDPQATP